MEMSEDVLIQYIKRELPADEMDKVTHQLKLDKELFHQYIQLKDIWDYTGLTSDVHQYDVKREWKRLPVRSAGRTGFMRLVGIAGIAAAVVIAFFVGQLIEKGSDNNALLSGAHVFTAPEGQITNVTLADGSTVVLNEGSSLSVPLNFGTDNRSVELSGEGYFDVSKNKELVFSVKSGKQEVKVLGTVFNIRAYTAEDKMITTLEEGIVRWEMEEHHITLKPGMQVVYDTRLGNIEQNTVDIHSVKQWALGRYLYEDAGLKEIVAVIEKWYGVTVNWQPADFAGQHFNGVIKRSASLEETLELMKVMLPIEYTINGQQVTIKRMR
ncbi:FecR domain-containing protein [Carboxylicivirga sediminis]|uniref:FecR domain-containing protein n=1 Tax=Carboxylicivirga sediminis TaxID=2006564 RepID=A0A941IWL9_9BACT|nr:FecR domain-containing protein [Carboxylicivirga sediminis]MBR8534688.1 FecR domain-containing protein [Carboxylicivirga sediminis]